MPLKINIRQQPNQTQLLSSLLTLSFSFFFNLILLNPGTPRIIFKRTETPEKGFTSNPQQHNQLRLSFTQLSPPLHFHPYFTLLTFFYKKPFMVYNFQSLSLVSLLVLVTMLCDRPSSNTSRLYHSSGYQSIFLTSHLPLAFATFV